MSLDWQINYKKIQDRNGHLLETGTFADCKFLVGVEDDTKTIAAHKVILASASPVFERMFYGELAEKSYPIVIPDVEPDTFKDLLKYIYTNQIEITSIDYAFELYYLGDKYMVKDVLDQCMEYIFNKVDEKNACLTYEFAKLFNLIKLKSKCMNIIAARTHIVLSQSNFTDIEFSTLLDILDRNQLHIKDEINLYYALERYAEKRVLSNNNNFVKHECGEFKSNPNEPLEKRTFKYNRNAFITEEEFRMALKKIRFLTMFPQDFARGPAGSKFLKPEEINIFFMLLLCPNDMDCSVPEGFTNLVSIVVLSSLSNIFMILFYKFLF